MKCKLSIYDESLFFVINKSADEVKDRTTPWLKLCSISIKDERKSKCTWNF